MIERLVDFRFEQRIKPRRLVVVPHELRVTDGRLVRMTRKAFQAVVRFLADLSAECRTAHARSRAENRKAFLRDLAEVGRLIAPD